MILSVSRRTDIPAFYMEWFQNRLQERSVLIRNPMNFHQVSRVDLSPEVVDCIVFWSKNPRPLMEYLDFLRPYPYYIQFTINPYGTEIESGLPPQDELIETFRALSQVIGPERMVWRYSPVLVNEAYPEAFHLEAFASLAERLSGDTIRCNLSFIEIYRKIEVQMQKMQIRAIPDQVKYDLVSKLRKIADENQIELRACGNLDLIKAGIPAAKCIDDALISKITGKTFTLKKDKNQDHQCYCVSSIDVGAYNTCLNGCRYCYANQTNLNSTRSKISQYNPNSPLLCSMPHPQDVIKTRAVKAEGSDQIRLPFL